MTAGPRRRERPITHLDAHVRPIELALIARAEALETETEEDPAEVAVALRMAREFRKLAEELKFW